MISPALVAITAVVFLIVVLVILLIMAVMLVFDYGLAIIATQAHISHSKISARKASNIDSISNTTHDIDIISTTTNTNRSSCFKGVWVAKKETVSNERSKKATRTAKNLHQQLHEFSSSVQWGLAHPNPRPF